MDSRLSPTRMRQFDDAARLAAIQSRLPVRAGYALALETAICWQSQAGRSYTLSSTLLPPQVFDHAAVKGQQASKLAAAAGADAADRRVRSSRSPAATGTD